MSVSLWEHYDLEKPYVVCCSKHGERNFYYEGFARAYAHEHRDCPVPAVTKLRRVWWSISAQWWNARYAVAAVLWPSLRDDTRELGEHRMARAERSCRELPLAARSSLCRGGDNGPPSASACLSLPTEGATNE